VARAWDAVQRLPEERRRAIVLRFSDELTAREIGEVLGRSEGAVRVLIHRALRSVADDLAAPPVAAPPAAVHSLAAVPAEEPRRAARGRWWHR
jgi:hypothetical protein